jgi:3-phenylpropionate/trans-cinnamate dioxygenase ferredoxin reductase subunit
MERGLQNYIIVGAGEAGVAAAAALRDVGFRGRIVLISGEDAYPYERPPVSKDAIVNPDHRPTLIRPPHWYAEREIDLRLGSIVSTIDRQRRGVRLETTGQSSEWVDFDRLLLATGSRVRRLPYEAIHYLRDWRDAEVIRFKLPQAGRVVIIGGGVIGMELASSLIAKGAEVTVIETASMLMGRALAPPISEWLTARHVEAGTVLRLGTSVAEIESRAGRHRAVMASGEEVDCDLVLAGIGVFPETRLAEELGCAIDDGIVVDGEGRTTVEGVFAAGEVAYFPHPLYNRSMRLEAWQHAGRHGWHVGRAMAGADGLAYDAVPWFWTDQLGVNVQVAGIASLADRTLWRGRGDQRTALHFAKDRLVGATTIDNGRDIRPATRLIAQRWSGMTDALTDEATSFAEIARSLLANGEGQSGATSRI